MPTRRFEASVNTADTRSGKEGGTRDTTGAAGAPATGDTAGMSLSGARQGETLPEAGWEPTANTRLIYLNNAATAWPLAPGVREAAWKTMSMPPVAPGRALPPQGSHDPAVECRGRLSHLLGVDDPSRIVLTSGATHAINLAVHGLNLAEGDVIVTSVTEHNSVLRPLSHVSEKRGVRILSVGLDARGGICREEFLSALKEKPRLVVLNHASNVTGAVQNIAPLFALAKQAGAMTLLDASQSFGHIPVDAKELLADMVAITGHKGCRGPAGTGALYVAPGIELEQVFVGGTGSSSELRLHPPQMPGRLEAGTPNTPALAGFSAALSWVEESGDEFNEWGRYLSRVLLEGLRATPGVRLCGDFPGLEWTGIVSFQLNKWAVEEAGHALADCFDVVCRTGLHCAPAIHAAIGSAPEGTIRFSPSGFNTEQEIVSVLEAVRNLASCRS